MPANHNFDMIELIIFGWEIVGNWVVCMVFKMTCYNTCKDKCYTCLFYIYKTTHLFFYEFQQLLGKI